LSPAFTSASEAGGKCSFSAMFPELASTSPVLASSAVTVTAITCMPFIRAPIMPPCIILLLITAATQANAWFDNPEKERRVQAEQQLQEQRQSTGGWQIVAGVMAIGAITLFTIGTALGSKLRRDANKS